MFILLIIKIPGIIAAIGSSARETALGIPKQHQGVYASLFKAT